jgi:exosortase
MHLLIKRLKKSWPNSPTAGTTTNFKSMTLPTPSVKSTDRAAAPRGNWLHRWLAPAASSLILLWVLFLIFPFASGDTASVGPLGWALWSMWTQSGNEAQDYSYCLIVPIMAAAVIFEKRKALTQAAIKGDGRAILVIFVGLIVFWIGARAGKQFVGCGGIQILLAGLIVWNWGWPVFRLLFFAWLITGFAWPLPFIDSTVAFPMRMIVSYISNATLNFIGVDSIRYGTALFSAPTTHSAIGSSFRIDIADPCSGIHSLMPMLMFSALYSHFFLSRRWSQWLVFLTTMPLIIVGNVVRILLLVMGCILWGAIFALGVDNDHISWYHETAGFVVFVVVLGTECLLGFILTAGDRRARRRRQGQAHIPVRTGGQPGPDHAPRRRHAIILTLAAITLALWAFTPRLRLSSEAGVIMHLPNQVTIPGWTHGAAFIGTPVAVSEAEHNLLPHDTEFARKLYGDGKDHKVFFSIVLSGLQQYSIHPPQVCLVAQGWTITGEQNVPIHLNSGHTLVVRNLAIARQASDGHGGQYPLHAYYMYWYVTATGTTPSHAMRDWMSSRDRILHNIDHRWAYMIAMSPVTAGLVSGGLDDAQTTNMLTDFIRQIIPYVQTSEAGQVVDKN